MKISYRWLQDYIKIDELNIEQLTELLTDIGLEVEGVEQIETVKGGLKDLVIGEVLACQKHENADRLQVCEVSVGGQENLQIVCGAPNVAAGQKVIVAPVNSTIHPIKGEGFTIKEAKIRGTKSYGMICAEDEIGLGEGHDGIMVLPSEATVGQLASDYFNIESDTIIEIGLTPNRSDANSHLGTARDLAAALQIQYNSTNKVNWPTTEKFAVENTNHAIDVVVEAGEDCPRYAGVVVSDITVKPSPEWMQNRLKAIGVKPINNIVDITNFINHEYGQPLHAFDYDKIKGQKIIVKTIADKTPFTTLDAVERKLSNEDLMICNENEPMCIAGVYGGLNTGITNDTTAVFLESAYFNPKTIRRTELRHNLRTDAAAKFEKGVDPTKQVEIAKRAALLVKELAGGTISSNLVDVQAQTIEPKTIDLSLKQLNTLTGVEFTIEKAVEILKALDFDILEQTEKNVVVKAPLYRADVEREADVIEEVLRIYGFNNVPLSGIANFAMSYKQNDRDAFINKLADHLSANGFKEIMTNSITKSSYYKNEEVVKEQYLVKPLNSLNAELDVMRPDLLHTGLEAIAYNQNRNQPNCKFYEFGKTYANYNGNYAESSRLALFLTGSKNASSWQTKAEEINFYDVKQVVEEILLASRISDTKESETKSNLLAEGLQISSKKALVNFGFVQPSLLKKMGIKHNVFFADFDFDALLASYDSKEIQFEPISKFPSIARDLALVIDKEVNYKQIQQIAQQKGGNHLKSINLFDVFTSEEKLGKDKKSYAVNFVFENKEQTLTNQEIDEQMKGLIQAFEQDIKAEIRE